MSVSDEAWAEGLSILASTFTGMQMDSALSRAWYRVIGPVLSDEQWLLAVDLYLATEEWPPNPAKLLAKVQIPAKVRAWRDREEGAAIHERLRMARVSGLDDEEIMALATSLGRAAEMALVGSGGVEHLDGPDAAHAFSVAYAGALAMAREHHRLTIAAATGVAESLIGDPRARGIIKPLAQRLDMKAAFGAKRQRLALTNGDEGAE